MTVPNIHKRAPHHGDPAQVLTALCNFSSSRVDWDGPVPTSAVANPADGSITISWSLSASGAAEWERGEALYLNGTRDCWECCTTTGGGVRSPFPYFQEFAWLNMTGTILSHHSQLCCCITSINMCHAYFSFSHSHENTLVCRPRTCFRCQQSFHRPMAMSAVSNGSIQRFCSTPVSTL